MEKTLRDELTDFICSVLDKTTFFTYEIIEFDDDDDVNILVTPDLKSLKNKESANFAFMLYCSDKTMLTIYCPTLYRIKNKDSAIYTLNLINTVNSKIAVGKIYLNPKNSSVISYINRILFNDITKELTVELLEDYIKSFMLTSLHLYNEIKDERNDKNN